MLVRKVDASSGFTIGAREDRGNVVLIDRFLDARGQAARFGRTGEPRPADWVAQHHAAVEELRRGS